MTLLQILGSGCPGCEQLAENAKKAAEGLGIEFQLEKVTELEKITEMGVLMTPALVVDGTVKSSGKILPVDEITSLLR